MGGTREKMQWWISDASIKGKALSIQTKESLVSKTRILSGIW